MARAVKPARKVSVSFHAVILGKTAIGKVDKWNQRPLSPSVSQNRHWAKGKSAEITKDNRCYANLPAFSLNLRVDIAQVGVSRLGTIFRTFLLTGTYIRQGDILQLAVH